MSAILQILSSFGAVSSPPCGTNNGTMSSGMTWSGGEPLFNGTGSKITPASAITFGTDGAISFRFTPGTFSSKYFFSTTPAHDGSGFMFVRVEDNHTLSVET